MYETKTEMEDTLYGREKERDSGMAVTEGKNYRNN